MAFAHERASESARASGIVSGGGSGPPPPPPPGGGLRDAFFVLLAVGLILGVGVVLYVLITESKPRRDGDAPAITNTAAGEDAPATGGAGSRTLRADDRWAAMLLPVLEETGGVWSEIATDSDASGAVNAYILVHAPLRYCLDVARDVDGWQRVMPRVRDVRSIEGPTELGVSVEIVESLRVLRLRSPESAREPDAREALLEEPMRGLTYRDRVLLSPMERLTETLDGDLNGRMVWQFFPVRRGKATVIRIHADLRAREAGFFVAAAGPAGPATRANSGLTLAGARLAAVTKAVEDTYDRARSQPGSKEDGGF